MGTVRVLASLPPDLLFDGERLRGLYARAMSGLVPDSIRLRDDKADFEPALVASLAGLLGRPALDSLLEMRALGDLGIVEPAAYRARFAQLSVSDGAMWTEVWPALGLEAFVRAFDEGRVLPRPLAHESGS